MNLDVFSECEPVYETFPGWEEDISEMTKLDELPPNAKRYVDYISEVIGVTIKMISVGTRRRQTIHLLRE